jgi:DNA polymerase-3 subunit delta'
MAGNNEGVMIGHEKILGDLQSLRKRETLGHGYVFHGPSMVGKKLLAQTFARSLEESDAHPTILSDSLLIEPAENGSIGIDTVREIKNFLWQKPQISLRRTLIINDAELLTTEAQNALLKITEEPPASSLLILITSDIESILPTIVSRLPKIYIAPVKTEVIAEWLVREHAVPKTKALELAKRAFGKPGLALRMLTDEDFQEQIAAAEKVLKTLAATRRDVIKKIIEPEEFNFRKFLDVMMLVLASQGVSAKNVGLLHKALALYDREANFSLNPRLQLEALLL